MRWPRPGWRSFAARWRVPAWARTRRSRGILLAALVLLPLWWFGARGERRYWPRSDVLDAIRFVESSDRDDVPDGDGGRAIGPYQIHRVYWQDAVAFDADVGGDYAQCRQRAYAERVIDAYMRRYAKVAWDGGEAEVIARIHNGGPQGQQNPKTDGYWQRVRARLP